MIDLIIKKDDDKIIAEYHLNENDRLDNLALGMLMNNDIKGVVSLLYNQIDDDRFFKYDITGMVTMREYLGEYVKKENILKTFYSVALAIRESTEYMINQTSFFLDLDKIYICKETGMVQLLCIPLLTVVNDGNLCNFFKNVLFSLQFELEENNDYVGRLINFLNSKTYSLDKFIYELENMLGFEHIVEEYDNEYENENDDEKNVVSVEFVTEETEDETVKNVEEFETEKVQKEISEIIGEVGIEKEQNPFLIKVSNKQKIMIDKEVFYVGSNESEVDYCIEDNPTVSDKHAYFIKHGKEYFVADNNTKGHTYLNKVEIQEYEDEVFIPHGAHVSFGTEEFEFRMHE